MTLTPRRAVLVAAALAVPAACAPPADTGSRSPSATAEPPPPASPTQTTSPTVERQPSPTPTAPASPTRAQVVASYGETQPRAWGLDLDGIVSSTTSDSVVLTLDACGGQRGSGIDGRILDALRAHRIPATLFLNARWIDANPAEAERLAADELFELGNHGTRHVPLSVTGREAYGIGGTADAGAVFDEVMGNHEVLTALTGTPPRFFRSGTAHYDDVAVRIVRDVGEIPVGFTINADGGATLSARQTAAELRRAKAGDIIIGHMNQPRLDAGAGFAEALPKLVAQGVRFAKLGDVLPPG